jgi:hypothetical protein
VSGTSAGVGKMGITGLIAILIHLQAIEMFAYAGFMLAVTLGFCLMSIFYYKYSFYEQEDNANDSGEKKNDK